MVDKRMGIDPWVGSGEKYKFPVVINSLNREGIFNLAQATTLETYTIWQQDSKKVEQIGLEGQDKIIWDTYINKL